MPDASYYEVRCERCRTSFAPGTKQCAHCGGAIGRQLLGFAMPGVLGGMPQPDAEPSSADGRSRFFRIAMLVLVVISAIGRACSQ
jgi:hypothetical protein